MNDCDGLRACEQCGNDTTGRLCRSCREQEAIDNDPMEDYELCSHPETYEDEHGVLTCTHCGAIFGDGDWWS